MGLFYILKGLKLTKWKEQLLTVIAYFSSIIFVTIPTTMKDIRYENENEQNVEIKNLISGLNYDENKKVPQKGLSEYSIRKQ